MSYIINTYNGAQAAVVEDGTINTTLDVKLIGKNYAGYGETQNENFVFLLENFANETAPPKAITGQVWFDSGSKKLKFNDGNQWRTTGGAEVSDTAPTGLTTGDFWWDTASKQLKAWDGSAFKLIGPQSAGDGITEMRSSTVRATGATGGGLHSIIEAIVGSDTIFIISKDAQFELDANVNGIAGFGKIRQGITLRNTDEDTELGVTQTDHIFWGTVSNSQRLGGFTSGDFIRSADANFSTLVRFADVGYSVGYPNQRLWVYNESSLTPTIHNKLNDTIVFKTTSGTTTKTPLKLVGGDLLPGENLVSNIGSSSLKYATVYATIFNGTASQADSLSVAGVYRTASTAATPSTIVSRTNSDETISGITVTAGSIKATYFVGTATTAYYADLAEKYLADDDYEVGTVVSVGGEKEVTASSIGQRAIGVVSENPAYMMNSELEGGTYIALKGRVPVKVMGSVKKGDRMAAGDSGCATAVYAHNNDVFAIALENNNEPGVKLVECVIL